MDDFVATLWRAFEVETHEHLEEIERILLVAEASSVDADRIAQLFRSWHSLKGLSCAMDLLGMEAVAHAAENILGLVRDGSAVLDGSLVAALLPAVDALRAGRQLAMTERRDQAPDEAVMVRLEDSFSRISGGRMLPAVRPAMSLVVDEVESACENESMAPVHDDPEMLRYFVELLREVLPVFTRIVTADFSMPEVQVATIDSIDRMERAADTMGFIALVDYARSLREIVEKSGVRLLFPDARKEVLRLLGLIGEALRQIDPAGNVSASGGGDLVTPDLRRVLGLAFEDELRETYCNIVQALSLFTSATEGLDATHDSDEMLA
ncbi:MAG: Hpt domain-containing protein, partial [Rhodospirillaceae bacterium]